MDNLLACLLNVLILALCGVTHVYCATCPAPDEAQTITKLKSSLFCNYDRYLRPVKSRNSAVTVNVSVDMKYLNIDEYNSNLMVIHSWIVTIWTDENLKWDLAQYENISYLVIPSDDIWIPDLSVYNSDLTQVMLFSSTTCILYSTGHVRCAPDLRTPIYCDQNLSKWPYDTQNCSLYLGSWAHTGEEIDIQLEDGKGFRKYLYMENNAWQLLSIVGKRLSTSYCCPNISYPYLVYHFELKRHAAMYAASIVAPAFVLAGITLISFWVRGIACRTCVCCTALIGDALFLQYIGYHLPANGDTSPDIVAFFRDAMVLTMMALVAALGVERIREQDTSSGMCGEAPGWLTGGAAWLRGSGGRPGQLLLGDGDLEQQETPQDVENVSKIPKCSAFATLLDRLAFLALFITYAIMLVALLP